MQRIEQHKLLAIACRFITGTFKDTEETQDLKMHPQENITCNGTTSPDFLTGIFVTLSGTGIITATLGNSLVFLAVYKTKTLRTSANYLLVSLSLASLMFVPVLASYAASLMTNECMTIPSQLCKWSSKLDFALFCVVMYHLAIISLDRLVAIKMPIRYSTLVTKKRTLATITVLWIAGALEGAFSNIFQRIQHKEGKILLQLIYGCLQHNIIPEESELKTIVPHFLSLMSLTVFVPSGVMLVTHAWIFIIAIRQYKRIRVMEDAMSLRRLTELRAAKTVAITVFSTLACYTPLLAVTFITAFEPPSGNKLNPSQFKVKFILLPSLKILYLLAISLNPLIFALKSRPFKEAFKRILLSFNVHLNISFTRGTLFAGNNLELTATKTKDVTTAV